MGGIVSAVAPVASALGGGGGVFGQILGTVLSSALAPSAPSAPTPTAAPAAPSAAPAPEAPTESSAADVAAEEPVIDTEAARVRAAKRRKAAEDEKLFSLSSQDDSVVLTKSLLGD